MRHGPYGWRGVSAATAVFVAMACAAAARARADAPAARSRWASPDGAGKLVYQALPAGDRIMDFSFAGYRGGGVKLPVVPVVKTVSPSGTDDSAAIQAAIDQVSQMPMTRGFRGAVLLGAGDFDCPETITIKTGGVVLRGSGSGPGGTVLRLTGRPHAGIALRGDVVVEPEGRPTKITDGYVPSGADAFHVADASAFHAGDPILITRPVTPQWVHFMGMDALVRNGKPQRWIAGEIPTRRTVREVSGNAVALDVPLSDGIDAKYTGPAGTTVAKCSVSGEVSEVGVESLAIVAPPQAVTIGEAHHSALRLSGVADAWVSDVRAADTVNSVGVGNESSRVTLERVEITHTVATKGAAKPADFDVTGTQVLLDRCASTCDNVFYFATGSKVIGPNVLLHCTFHGNGHVQPHMRWATGLLVDNCQAPEGGIDFMNRGVMGSGHGWTVGWAVAWNCVAKSFVIENPPGATNWAVGCRGAAETGTQPGGPPDKLPQGELDSWGAPVAPASLYLEQLRERLGPGAVRNIGY